MHVVATKSAVILVVGCALMLAIALLAVSPTAMFIASGLLLVLSAAYAMTAPVGGRLRQERLEFAWWVAHSDPNRAAPRIVPETAFVLRCYIRWRGRNPLRLSSLYPVMPNGIDLVERDDRDLVLPAEMRSEFDLRLIAAAPGRFVLQGLSIAVPGALGLFYVPVYFPNPLALKVLPRASIRLARIPQPITGQHTDRCGLRLPRRHGDGVELREIREFVPGDPFKVIAWMASARAGKLMVREVEQEVQAMSTIIIDVSGSMRAGRLGRRKLDLAIEIAASRASRALEAGDRVGLITEDGRILSHVAPAEGPQQLLRIYDALLASTEVVDADLTEEDDRQLVTKVGRYLWQQEGVDFSSTEGFRKHDMAAYVDKLMRADGDASLDFPVNDPDGTSTQLRRFCKSRGIPLQYRAFTPGEVKASGLARALSQAGGGTRMPQSITVITDFDGILDFDKLIKTLNMLRRRGQTISVIFPDAISLAEEPQSELDRDLYRVYGMRERRRAEQTRSVLGPLGVPLLVSRRRGAAVDFESGRGSFRQTP
ncbi:MAG: DUF58 domain-containing protein [Deltaproteobacteria bacterium]|nr:DUF58 domain-containing protein [Deltaproteobacteria bacterium]